MEGQCQCGKIKFITPLAKPTNIYICHCWECRHQSSSLFGMTATFPYFKLREPFAGDISNYTRLNQSGLTIGYFCTSCGSRLLHENTLANGESRSTVSVKAGCLDGLEKEDFKKAIHIWTKSALIDIPAGVEQYEEDPPEVSSVEV